MLSGPVWAGHGSADPETTGRMQIVFRHWPPIGPHRSRDDSAGLWLVKDGGCRWWLEARHWAASALVWTQRGPVWSLKVGTRVLGWVLEATDRRLHTLTSSPASHPLPASGHQGAPAVAVVQQCTVHKLTKPISPHKGCFFPSFPVSFVYIWNVVNCVLEKLKWMVSVYF